MLQQLKSHAFTRFEISLLLLLPDAFSGLTSIHAINSDNTISGTKEKPTQQYFSHLLNVAVSFIAVLACLYYFCRRFRWSPFWYRRYGLSPLWFVAVLTIDQFVQRQVLPGKAVSSS